MVIDHLGIAVKSLEDGIQHWEKLFGYHQDTEIIVNTRQQTKVVFLTKENSLSIKLVEPTSQSSPLCDFVRRGGGFHHIGFKCDNLNDELGRLKEYDLKDLRIMTLPEPGEAFENELLAFIVTKQKLNIELIDTDKRTGQMDENV